jgi:hypothetical protein
MKKLLCFALIACVLIVIVSTGCVLIDEALPHYVMG